MAFDILRRPASRAVAALMLAVGASAPAFGNELWVAPTYQQDLGGLGIGSNGFWPATAVGAARFAWAVPNDLQTFQSARIAIIPHASANPATLNYYV